jgi:site-specific DNA-adenine methylase
VAELRPFFSFYGSKWRLAKKYYPLPKFETVIEPFAGSAGYALRYADRKIILYEADPVIAGIWKYLISVKASEIRAIKDLKPTGSVEDLKVPQEAKWLVGFWLNRCVCAPRIIPTKWMREGKAPSAYWGERVRNTIASQVDSIRHWKVVNASYNECPNQQATWFIDPPYEKLGFYYTFGNKLIDYKFLAEWCRAREGQVMVCENVGAKWLPFKHVGNTNTARNGISKEALWTRG